MGGEPLDDSAPLALPETRNLPPELGSAVRLPGRVSQRLPVFRVVRSCEEVPDGGEPLSDEAGSVLGGRGHLGAHRPPRAVAFFWAAIHARTSVSS
ncbi:effector-associated domain 2-containing protein [Brachybacterium paraconglomeratum]|uniref:effector-associated domain 2-containing protein n=1 Tax=Brachybacterium paraconglomeratum TaxID=173362 RepID=UPI003A4DC759